MYAHTFMCMAKYAYVCAYMRPCLCIHIHLCESLSERKNKYVAHGDQHGEQQRVRAIESAPTKCQPSDSLEPEKTIPLSLQGTRRTFSCSTFFKACWLCIEITPLRCQGRPDDRGVIYLRLCLTTLLILHARHTAA